MNKLYTFGCSYTANYNLTTGAYQKYYKFRNDNFPPVWGEVLSNLLRLEFINYGKESNSNDAIFSSFIQHIDEYKEGDILIVQWSYLHRFRWVYRNINEWISIGAGNLGQNPAISNSTHKEIIQNRLHIFYKDDVYEKMKFIEKYCECKNIQCYFWSGDNDLLNDKPLKQRKDKKYLISDMVEKDETPFTPVMKMGGQRIIEETNGLIDDIHFGESAHKIMGELFYKHIKEEHEL